MIYFLTETGMDTLIERQLEAEHEERKIDRDTIPINRITEIEEKNKENSRPRKRRIHLHIETDLMRMTTLKSKQT